MTLFGRRGILAGMAVVIAGGAMTVHGHIQSVQFYARADAVRVPVRVMDGNRPVLGLRPDQFVLKDNGVVQTIDAVATIDALEVVMAVDVSRSVGPAALDRLRALTAHIVNSTTAEERVGLVAFSDAAALVAPLSLDRSPLQSALAALTPHSRGRTALWDAIAASGAAVAVAGARPYVVALTDGCDNASQMSREGLSRWLGQLTVTADIVFFGSHEKEAALLWEDLRLADDLCHGPLRLDSAVVPSGGRIFRTADRGIERDLTDRLRDLRSGYFLSYTPKGVAKQDGWHKIEVSLKGASGRVDAGPGYFSGR